MSDVNSVLKCKIWSYREKLEYKVSVVKVIQDLNYSGHAYHREENKKRNKGTQKN